MKRLFFILFLPGVLFAKAGFETPWGKDSDLYAGKKKVEDPSLSILGKAANAVISFHQNFITQVDGPRSSFRPTSSRYMQLAINRYGFFKGYVMGCDRLLRENDEEWVYQKIVIDDYQYKFDPARDDKHFR